MAAADEHELGAVDNGEDATSASAESVSSSSDAQGFPDLSGRVLAGRYRIEQPLADGGMSRVFIAQQLDLGRKVAMKFLKQPGQASLEGSWLDRFKQEAGVLASLSHANLVTVHEFGTSDEGFAFLVMEHAEGRTLSSLVREAGTFTPERIVRVAMQIAAGLEEAHGVGVVHRDLKPANVLVATRRSDRVKVIDFGIAKLVDGATESTRDDIRVGSPRYMAPEQVNGDPVSAATDIYALGCVMYLMATGRPPFVQTGAVSVMVAHVNEAPKPIRQVRPDSHLSAPLEEIVLRCLAKAPADRFASMGELMRALAATPENASLGLASSSMEISASSSRSAQIGSALEARRERRRVAQAGLVAATVVGVALLAWLWPRSEETVPAPSTVRAEPPAITRVEVPREAAPREAAPTTPAMASVLVDSLPPGATVHRGDVEIGVTPVRLAVPPSAPVRVRLSLPNYVSTTVELSAVEPNPVVRLSPAARARRRVTPSRFPTAAPAVAAEAPPPPAPSEPIRRRVTDNLDPWSD